MASLFKSLIFIGEMAGATGLEPAASAVTGQRSNQLSYAPAGVGVSYRGGWRKSRTSLGQDRDNSPLGRVFAPRDLRKSPIYRKNHGQTRIESSMRALGLALRHT